MKKIIFLIMCVFFTGITSVNAQTEVCKNTERGFSIVIYGDINTDLYYTYGTKNNQINQAAVFKSGYHTVGSQSFLDDSYLGFNMTYKNLALKFELGISDYVRKYLSHQAMYCILRKTVHILQGMYLYRLEILQNV